MEQRIAGDEAEPAVVCALRLGTHEWLHKEGREGGHRASRRRAGVAALLVLTTLVVAGCGDRGTAGAGISDSARARVAAFRCPSRATTAGGSGHGSLTGGGKLQVVTTVAPITSIVANVAGDRAEVTGIIPEGTDSHTYEPKPSAAASMAKADVVFVNGLKLEDPTKELARANAPKAAEVVELGTLTLSPDEYIYDFSFPKAGGKPNPHLWTNPPMAKCYAVAAASVLGRFDPANSSYYQANAVAFGAKIDRLDRLMKEATATMAPKDRELLTYHDAYAYFAAHYGWKILGAVQVSSFEDPTPREISALIEQIKREKVPAVFGSEVFPSPVLAQVARETGARYVDKLRDDDLPGAPGDVDHSYLGLMKFDFVTMVSNLGGDARGLRSFDSSDVVHDQARYPQ